jgi:hypothetical protein
LLVKTVLLYLGKNASQLCRVWRNETGLGLNPRTHKPFKYGLVGSSDILGILNNGKLLCIECKTGNATQSTQQKNFQRMIDSFNGLYIVVHCPDDALRAIKNFLSLP